LEGRLKPYIRPIRLYIIGAIHLIAMSHSFQRLDLFKSRDRDEALQRVIEGTAQRKNMTTALVEEQINAKLSKAFPECSIDAASPIPFSA
jgi:hypothetical protein